MHLRMADQTHEPDRTGWQPADAGAFDDVVEQLEAYFDGSLIEFDVEFHLEAPNSSAGVGCVAHHSVR